ncbi:unnamed protein product, partial [marine sediment metagenome]
MQKGLIKLYTGDFNIMNQELQLDGSVLVTLSSEHYPESYRMRVEDLYGGNEKILEHEV